MSHQTDILRSSRGLSFSSACECPVDGELVAPGRFGPLPSAGGERRHNYCQVLPTIPGLSQCSYVLSLQRPAPILVCRLDVDTRLSFRRNAPVLLLTGRIFN